MESSSSQSYTNTNANASCTQSQPSVSLPSEQSQPLSQNTPVPQSEVVSNEGENRGKKRKGKSIVWEHCKKVERLINGEVKHIAICDHCQEEMPAHPKNNKTTGIKTHLERKCKTPPLYNNKLPLGQTTLSSDTIGGNMVYHVFNQKRSDLKCIHYVIRGEVSFRSVEGIGFKEFIHKFQPRFTLPTRKKVASRVWDLFKVEKEKLLNVIRGKRVSVTTDTWTSIQTINYMVITCHFLDSEWTLHKRIISFTKITSHKGEEIGKTLEVCLNGWGIDKFFSITVDNASANDGAVEYMKKRFRALNTLLFEEKYMHMRCGCHILNLIVGDGMKELYDSIEAIRNCVKYIHSSPAKLDKFREFCVLLQKDKMANVPLDVSTRWNATFKLLEGALKYRVVFTRMAEEYAPFGSYFDENVRDTKRVGPPSDMDWDNAIAFAHFLGTFHETTLKLSATKTPTSNLIFTKMVAVQVEIQNKMYNDGDPVLQRVACSMKSKFDKYWGSFEGVNNLIYVANVLDPRCKLQMIKICYKLLNASIEKSDHVCDRVKVCMYDLYKEYFNSTSTITSVIGEEGDCSVEITQARVSGNSALDLMMKELAKNRRAEQLLEISNEVDKYLFDPFETINTFDFDLLLWWKVNQSKYPILSMIAHDIFAIPSSTVASENAFSLGGRIVDPFRASLTPKMVEALVCTSDWLRATKFNFYKEPKDDDLQFYKELEELEASPIPSQSSVTQTIVPPQP